MIIDHSQIENKKLQVEIETIGGNGNNNQFVRERIDEVVNKEVQVKLNNLA